MSNSTNKTIKAYVLERAEAKVLKGGVSKFYTQAIIGDTICKLSSFNKDMALKLSPKTTYKLINVVFTESYGYELKGSSMIMESHMTLTGVQQELLDNFFNLPVITLQEASAVQNYKRISIGPIWVTEIGDICINGDQKRRVIHLANAGRTAQLTMWGDRADLLPPTDEELVIIHCHPVNDYKNTRCYSSNISTDFKMYHNEEVKEFSGEIDSVSFDSNLIEVNDLLMSIKGEMLKEIFPSRAFSPGKVVSGKRKATEILEINPVVTVKRAKKD